MLIVHNGKTKYLEFSRGILILEKIRVTYSGLIAFGIRLVSIFTGLIFTLIVTRQLSPQEFGTWGLINGIIIYAMIINPIINYWVTREIARGEKTGKTAIFSSSIFSVGGVCIYLISAYIVGIQSDADLNALLFATLLVPVIFLYNCLTAINLAYKPQAISYGFLVFEILKIPAGLFFVYFYGFGVQGAILATLLAYVASTVVLGFYAKEQLRTRFQKEYLLKWMRFFWIPFYRSLPGLIQMSDVTVFSIITGSVVGVAYFTAARTFGMLVNHVRGFNTGLYPKLLETGKQEFLQENLIKLFYFAFPLTAFSITFAKPGLFALNPIYQAGVLFVVFISLRMFLKTLNQILFQALEGIEGIDKNRQSTFKDYLKSKLVWISTFDLIRHSCYIGILAVMLLIFSSQTDSVLDLVFYWSIIGFIVEVPLTFYIIHTTRKSFTLKIDKKRTFKYLVVSIVVFGLVGFYMEENLEYKNSIFEFLPSLFIFVVISVGGYLGITYLIDKKTKILFKAIWNELANKPK